MPYQRASDLSPLAGVKVVSLAVNIPGPVAAARLRELGASITKIEPPDGDALAGGCPDWYQALHEDVTILRMNLKEESDRQKLFVILEEADLLLTSSRPVSLAHLRLSWSELHPRFPQLCHVAIVGHLPPDENLAGHDLTYQASLGLIAPPELPRTLLADLGGAEETLSTAIALLLARERGRGAQAASISLAEAARRFAIPHQQGLTTVGGLLGGAWPAYNLYEAAEGWVAVAAIERQFAERLARELEIPSLSKDSLAQAFRQRTADEWERWAAAHDLPIAAVRPEGSLAGPGADVQENA
jgi:alpha-methylacyl-CoA racemase